jgi:hypothetical protein
MIHRLGCFQSGACRSFAFVGISFERSNSLRAQRNWPAVNPAKAGPATIGYMQELDISRVAEHFHRQMRGAKISRTSKSNFARPPFRIVDQIYYGLVRRRCWNK